MPQPQPRPEPAIPPARPVLADDPAHFLVLEREVEMEFRPQMLAALQRRVDAFAAAARAAAPLCPKCARPMRCQDTREVSWLARCGWFMLPCRDTAVGHVDSSAGHYWICWG